MHKVYIAAGGTGGHINAALAVGEYLSERYEVNFLTGERYLDYQLFKNTQRVTHIKTRPLRTNNPFKIFYSLLLNSLSFLQIMITYMKMRPKFIIGAGGYVCGPSLFAGFILNIPVFLIEQNSVMGLTNRLLIKISKKIFLNFKNTKGLDSKYEHKCIVSGNPIRNTIKSLPAYPDDKEIAILVFGGSLGAIQVNEAIHKLVKMKFKQPINIYHQVGKGNLVDDLIVGEGIKYTQVEYIDEMNKAYLDCHIIVSRAGASTISELEYVRKPSILIPYPGAVDNHQEYNAINLRDKKDFYVSVIDYRLEVEKIMEEIYKEINKILDERLFFRSEKQIEKAVKIIASRIEACLE